ncbi:MAG: potassium transporter [Gammaproteobacteria bacterium]|nr:potassium transporter [Gammaproteobacteria bacterium]
MQLRIIQRIVGLLLTLFSLAMLPPLLFAWHDADGALPGFALSFAVALVCGLALWLPVRTMSVELRLRDGFLVVVLSWVMLALFGALPFVFTPGLAYTDAVFESFSGLTTTGATVMNDLDALPRSVLYYRQQLQWLGGMGIIVLAVAILPMLGIGGMQLFRAETPGPMKDNRLTPRITETAKALWYLYLGLTLLCASAYWIAGMTLFDAVGHSFSTVSIGGFSTHDASLGHFDNPMVEIVATFFMAISGANFALHFLAWRGASVAPYLRDPEFRTYLTVLGCLAAVSGVYLYASGIFDTPGEALQRGLFQAVAIATTAGFTTAEYQQWPPFLPVLLLMSSFIGGCAGSAGGGLKVIRVLLLMRQGTREIKRLVHPSAHYLVKIGNKALSGEVIDSIWGFFSLYVVCFCTMTLLLAATGLDLVTAFSAVAACINNMGVGLGGVGSGFADLNPASKWVLCVAMLLGRLEMFTLLVLFMPGFWRK